MTYKIKLTDAEMETLGWLTDRGYFPEETYDGMVPILCRCGHDEHEGQCPAHDGCWCDSFVTERTWNIPEPAAWSILTQREEDPDSLYTCCGGELLEKLLKLEEEIV